MLKKITQIKKWQLWLYVALLVAVIVAMISLKNCGGSTIQVSSHGRVTSASGGDTIDVAFGRAVKTKDGDGKWYYGAFEITQNATLKKK